MVKVIKLGDKMIRAAVLGATGYAGAELVRLLAGHPGVTLTMITSRQYAGTPFDRVYPSLAGCIDLVCETALHGSIVREGGRDFYGITA